MVKTFEFFNSKTCVSYKNDHAEQTKIVKHDYFKKFVFLFKKKRFLIKFLMVKILLERALFKKKEKILS